MATVHFDEDVKRNLIDDIITYLDPNNRRCYMARGNPYRREYLLHGPPGTGKTSLSLALAGHFGLELYLVHVSSIRSDAEMEQLFLHLPTPCIVLLEDFDVIGLQRQQKEDTDDEKTEKSERSKINRRLAALRDITLSGKCTLSWLLNILDRVASQEGRLLLMTSNHADMLDQALVRPGRIDKQIYFRHVTPKVAEQMFNSHFEHGNAANTNPTEPVTPSASLTGLALEFSIQIPEDEFTPAQIQGYLLLHRNSPVGAANGIQGWINDEKDRAIRARERAERAKMRSKARAKKTDTPKTSGGGVGVVDSQNGPLAPGLSRVLIPTPASTTPSTPVVEHPLSES